MAPTDIFTSCKLTHVHCCWLNMYTHTRSPLLRQERVRTLQRPEDRRKGRGNDRGDHTIRGNMRHAQDEERDIACMADHASNASALRTARLVTITVAAQIHSEIITAPHSLEVQHSHHTPDAPDGTKRSSVVRLQQTAQHHLRPWSNGEGKESPQAATHSNTHTCNMTMA